MLLKIVLDFVFILSLSITNGVTNEEQRDAFLYGTFPEDFKWGFSTSSYQTEGAYLEDGKGLSIWDTFTHQNPSPIADKSNGDIACDSYHKYQEDVDLLKETGATAFRFSLSWPRILPRGTLEVINEEGIEYYNKFIDAIISAGIEPIITLYHWDLPQDIQDSTNGWINESIVEHFKNYADLAFSRFGDRVKTWMTFNEAWVVCQYGYGTPLFPPAFNDRSGHLPYVCVHNVLKSHAEVYHLYKNKYKKDQGGKVGIVVDTPWFEPQDPSNPEDLKATERALQFKHGLFVSPLIFGKYPDIVIETVERRSKNEGREVSKLPVLDGKWPDFMKGTVDVLGLNHYTTNMVTTERNDRTDENYFSFLDMEVKEWQDESWAKGASPWLKSVPWGLRKTLNWIKNTYGSELEVLITENGFSDKGEDDWDDGGRVEHFKGYINEVLKAVVIDGCNVKGFLAWSLTDNFEWIMGYKERFGVHWVNFTDPERTRIPKKSAIFLSQVFADNGFVRRNEKEEL